jgi:hypothetical protein
MPAITIDEAKKAAIDAATARAAAEADLAAWWAEQESAGFTTAEGYALGLAPSDVALLTGNYLLAKEAAALGAPIPPVFDKDGTPHEVPDIAALTGIMLAYGQHRAAISAEYAARKSAITQEPADGNA